MNLTRGCQKTYWLKLLKQLPKPLVQLVCSYSLIVSKWYFVGSSTACVLVVHQERLYSANLGDSGFMIVRDGKVLTKSKEQVHYFNAPFQLTLPPEG